MYDIPVEIPEELVAELQVTGVTPLSGGDVAKAFRIDTPDGPLFLKTHPDPRNEMFEREARGLVALNAATAQPRDGVLGVPVVRWASLRGLVLEWIEQGSRTPEADATFGMGLAQLHKAPKPHFGRLHGDRSGYLGSVPVDVTPTASWVEFYVDRRLRPLIAQAVDKGVIASEASQLFDNLVSRAEELCGPPEPPALLHGDLWGGNRMVDTNGRNWLIDPAAFYGHREVDLAMMLLFGGFGDEAFMAYNEHYPLADGWHDRVSWYQLAPLLVHALLFGGGYGASVMNALHKLQ